MSLPTSTQTSHETSTGSDGHTDDQGAESVTGRSPIQLAVRRFRRDKLSMAAFVVIALFVVAAVTAPILVKLGVLDPYALNQGPDVLDVNLGGIPIGAFGGVSWSHPLGLVPGTGTDVLSRLWLGLTLSLSIALAGAILTIGIGTAMGIISGFSGGIIDAVIGRIIDLTLAFPALLMLLALSTTITARMTEIGVPNGPNAAFVNGLYIVVVLAIFGWPPTARIIRGQVLSIREREFVDASVLLGASRMRIYFKEILPNLWAPVLVYFTLTMPAYISAEAALSYLGVGIKTPTPTLGNVLADSVNYANADFTFFFVPALIIATIVVSFNLLGDGLRDALDPKGSR